MSRRKVKRSASQGGILWTVGGLLLILACLVGVLQAILKW